MTDEHWRCQRRLLLCLFTGISIGLVAFVLIFIYVFTTASGLLTAATWITRADALTLLAIGIVTAQHNNRVKRELRERQDDIKQPPRD
jgi:general stress protein CsbA